MSSQENLQNSLLSRMIDGLSRQASHLAESLHKEKPEQTTPNTPQHPESSPATTERIYTWMEELPVPDAQETQYWDQASNTIRTTTSLRHTQAACPNIVCRPADAPSDDMILPHDSEPSRPGQAQTGKHSPQGLSVNKTRDQAAFPTTIEIHIDKKPQRNPIPTEIPLTHRCPSLKVTPWTVDTIGKKQGLAFSGMSNRKDSSSQTGEYEQSLINKKVRSLAKKIPEVSGRKPRKTLETDADELCEKLEEFRLAQEEKDRRRKLEGIDEEEEEEDDDDEISSDAEKEPTKENKSDTPGDEGNEADIPTIQTADQNRKAYFQERAAEYAGRYAAYKPINMASVRRDFDNVESDVQEICRMAKVIDDARKEKGKEEQEKQKK